MWLKFFRSTSGKHFLGDSLGDFFLEKNFIEIEELLGGGNSNIFLFNPYVGEMIQFDYIIFFKWVENHQLVIELEELEIAGLEKRDI